MFVQFSNDQKTEVVAIFANEQPDKEIYPNQGEIEDDDPRYLTFVNPPRPPEPDPIDKLKAFLASSPDVAAILS